MQRINLLRNSRSAETINGNMNTLDQRLVAEISNNTTPSLRVPLMGRTAVGCWISAEELGIATASREFARRKDLSTGLYGRQHVIGVMERDEADAS